MPRLSSFYGIVITMYYKEDHPVAHFHATYSGHAASYTVAGARLLAGHLPVRAHRMVRQWALLHEAELSANWDRMLRREPPVIIEPLP